MTKQELYEFIHKHRLAVLATVSTNTGPEAAVVGFAVSADLEIIFDTLKTTRKYANLTSDPRIAFVIGWDDEITVQYEGEADEPQGVELDRFKRIYFQTWPDGVQRQMWPDLLTSRYGRNGYAIATLRKRRPRSLK